MSIIKIIKQIKDKFINSYERSYFLPILILVSSILILNLFSFLSLEKNKELKNKSNNELITKNINSYFDMEFRDIDNIIRNISNTCLRTFRKNTRPNDYEKYLVANEIAEQMKQNQCIEELVIISKYSDTVITSLGTSDKEGFFANSLYSEKYSSIYWENLNSGVVVPQLMPASSFINRTSYPSEKTVSLIPVVWSLPECMYNVITFINEEKLLKKQGLSGVNDLIDVNVYNEGNILIFSNTKGKEIGNGPLNSRSVIKMKSNYNNYTYLYQISKKYQIYDYIAFFIFAFSVFAALYFSKMLSRKFAKPISEISRMIADKEVNYDLSQLSRDVGKIVNEHTQLLQERSTGSEDLMNTIVLKMATDTTFYIHNKQYIVSVLGQHSYMPYYSILYILTNQEIGIQAIDQLHSIAAFRSGKYGIVVLLEDKQAHDVESIAKSIQSVLKHSVELQKCTWIAAISTQFTELSDLYKIYTQTSDLIQYRSIKSSGCVITGNEKITDYSLTSASIDEFMIGIYAGDKTVIKSFLDITITQMWDKNISFIKFKAVVYTLMGIFTNTVLIKPEKVQSVYEMEQLFNRILGMEKLMSAEIIKQAMLNYINLALAEVQNKETHLDRSNIMKYIHDYYDTDIYLEKMATIFNTSPKYFSSYFKEEFQIGFIKYLTQVRITHAKKMLLQTTQSLDEISLKVGYKNTATFITAFKSVTGTTPGKFRLMNEH